MAIVKNKPLLDVLRQHGKVTTKQYGGSVTFDLALIAPPQTEIFVLSPEVALAAEKMVRSPSFKMPKLEELRFPYPFMAIEIPLTKEIQALRAHVTSGLYPLERMGIYIASNHEDGWVNCSTYWGYADGAYKEPPLFSFTAGTSELIDGLGGVPTVGVATPQNPHDMVYFKVLPSTSVLDGLQRANVPPERMALLYSQPQSELAVKESVSELPLLLFACNLMLSCKTGVKYTKVAAKTPPPGLSLGKHKKKRYSASAYTVMHLEEIESVDSDGNITQRADIAAHYVRGHFKQRKHGVYWWNPFVRGKGDPQKREAYIVKREPQYA